MSFVQITNILDEAKNQKGIVTKAKFNKIFEILPAVDDGNCLFSSVEQLFSLYDLHQLRQLVCEYYKTFDKYAEYPENSIKGKLQIQLISDNKPEYDEDEEIDENPQLHEEAICTNFEWAGVMDVIALTDILNVNIILMIMRKEGYTVQPFLNKKSLNTLCIKFNGKDHFEPLLPKFEVETPKSSSSNKSKSKSKSKSSSNKSYKNALDTAKDISSETRRLITQMEDLGLSEAELRASSKKHSPSKKHSSPKRTTRRNTGKGIRKSKKHH